MQSVFSHDPAKLIYLIASASGVPDMLFCCRCHVSAYAQGLEKPQVLDELHHVLGMPHCLHQQYNASSFSNTQEASNCVLL